MSDGSYDVNSDNEQPTTPPEGETAPETSEGKCGGCCCCCCKDCLRNHPDAVRRFQEMIFLYKPVPLVIMIVLVNLCFFIYRKLSYSPVSLFFLGYAIYTLITAFYEKVTFILDPILFGSDVTKAEGYNPNASNRIYSVEEIEGLFGKCSECSFVQSFNKTVKSLKTNETLVGRAIWACIVFVIFLISLFLCLFWPVVVITNLLLIVPGILLHPQIYPKWIVYVKKDKQD